MNQRNAAQINPDDLSRTGDASHAALLAFVRALAIRQARIDAMIVFAANDNRPS